MTADGQEINGSTGTDHLRLRAEQELQNKRSNSATLLSDIDVRKRLHELQVTQIELALQNSELLELQHARQEIELLLARYLVQVGIARQQQFDKQSCEVLLLNGEQRPFYAHIEANADAAEHTCRLVVEDISARKAAEKSLQNAHDELETKVQERTAALMLANAQLKAEIAEHKRTEAALRHTQYILNQAQRVAHVGCWERNNVSGAPQWSDEFFRICGLPPQAFTPNLAKLLQVIHPEDRNAVYRMVRRAIDHNHNFNSISRIIRPDGTIRHVRFQGNILRSENRKLQTLVGSVLDITEFKNAEEALLQSQETIRRLAAHQEWVKENERKRIAREIHDELGQNLLALRIDVSMLAARTEHCHPRLNAKVKAALNDIDVTIRSVRGIINNLRPAVLDLGLPAAFEWQVKEFQRRNGIACNLNISGGDADYQLEDDLATALFRILQESLTNISRHARADRITISLSKDACDNVVMKVADNGIGLPQDSRRKANSYGLIGIRERVNTLRGELIIDSHQNQGTALTVIIPTECPPPGNVG